VLLKRIAAVKLTDSESRSSGYGGVQSLDHGDFLPGVFSQGLGPESPALFEVAKVHSETWYSIPASCGALEQPATIAAVSGGGSRRTATTRPRN
jgi:hypothetical protein